jgi:arsenite methyltransferase
MFRAGYTTYFMKYIQVYDPPMCCSTGVCGPDIDPTLPVFAGMLQQLKNKGIAVERYNLAQQPLAFVQNAAVRELLDKEGVEVLPLIFCDGKLALKGAYPDGEQRAELMRAVIDA